MHPEVEQLVRLAPTPQLPTENQVQPEVGPNAPDTNPTPAPDVDSVHPVNHAVPTVSRQAEVSSPNAEMPSLTLDAKDFPSYSGDFVDIEKHQPLLDRVLSRQGVLFQILDRDFFRNGIEDDDHFRETEVWTMMGRVVRCFRQNA